jgi:hypothetical protein
MSDPLTNRFRPHVEGLEEREVLSATVSLRGGVLHIRGSKGPDKVTVAYQGGRIVVRQPGPQAKSSGFATAGVNRIVFQGQAGNDTFINDTNVPAIVSTGSGNNFVTTLTGQDVITTGAGINQVLAALGDVVPATNGRTVVVIQQITIFPVGNTFNGFTTTNALSPFGFNESFSTGTLGTFSSPSTGINAGLGTGFNGLATPTSAGVLNGFPGSPFGLSGVTSTGVPLTSPNGTVSMGTLF